jgi:hypothetical protein
MQEKQIKDISLSAEIIRENVYIIRGQKVMLDRDLAMLYGVPTKVLNQSVKRNLRRFPEDFMFELTKEEVHNWKSQFVTSNSSLVFSLRKPPLAFTEQGIAMLSSVLNSDRAIDVNIQIIRVFTKMREMMDAYKDLREKVEEMELNNEFLFNKIFTSIASLTYEKEKPKGKFGFVADK